MCQQRMPANRCFILRRDFHHVEKRANQMRPFNIYHLLVDSIKAHYVCGAVAVEVGEQQIARRCDAEVGVGVVLDDETSAELIQNQRSANKQAARQITLKKTFWSLTRSYPS